MAHQYKTSVSVTHKCGHVVTTMEGGRREDRDRLRRQRAENECWACREAKGGYEVLQIDGADFHVPAIIVGTDKQISWAVAIRKSIIKKLMENRCEGENPLTWILFKSNAKFWIDHRNDQTAALAQDQRQAA